MVALQPVWNSESLKLCGVCHSHPKWPLNDHILKLSLCFVFRWIQRNEEVGQVVEALDDIEDIVTKDALIVQLKKVTFEKVLCKTELSTSKSKWFSHFVNSSTKLDTF